MDFNTKQRHLSYDVTDYQALAHSEITRGLAETPGMRFDSAEDASLFFARELDYIKSQSYDVVYPEFTALSLFPISSEVNPGAETITYYSYDKSGMAKIISNYATDLSRADVKGKPTSAFVRSIGSSYGYSVQEMRASRMAGKSLDARKAESARYQMEYLVNKIAWAGDKDSGLLGILSEENDIPKYVIPTGASGKTEWTSKTPDEILADINGMQRYTAKITKNVERPDTLVLPSDIYIEISTRQIPNTGFTVKKFIEENAPYLTSIVAASELQADSTDMNPTGKNVALLFKKDAKKLTLEIPMPFYQYPLQPVGLEVTVPCEERVAGMMIYYPLSLLLAEGI